MSVPSSDTAAVKRAAIAADASLLDATDDIDADVARLRHLPGIGEWTAQYIALRGLKHADAFPASDLGILRALADPDGRRPTPAEALARLEHLRAHGPTPTAFTFRHRFEPGDAEARLGSERDACGV